MAKFNLCCHDYPDKVWKLFGGISGGGGCPHTPCWSAATMAFTTLHILGLKQNQHKNVGQVNFTSMSSPLRQHSSQGQLCVSKSKHIAMQKCPEYGNIMLRFMWGPWRLRSWHNSRLWGGGWPTVSTNDHPQRGAVSSRARCTSLSRPSPIVSHHALWLLGRNHTQPSASVLPGCRFQLSLGGMIAQGSNCWCNLHPSGSKLDIIM